MKYFFVTLMLSVLFTACSTTPTPATDEKQQSETGYVVVLDTAMTLAEFAKANQIGEPYLRQQLGMPTRGGSTIPLYQLKRNFKFSFEKLTGIVEKAKNRK